MPMLPWMKKKDGEDHQIEVSLSDDTQKKLDSAVAVADEIPKIKEMLKGLDSISDYVKTQKDKEEAATREAAARKQQEHQASDDDEISELLLTDPRAAINKATSSQAAAIMMLRADNLKRQIFEDQKERFPFYTGEIKSEIDKLVDSQTLQHRNDPSVIENAYFTIVGKHSAEITEGKLKNRFATAEVSRGVDGKMNGKGEGDKLEITDDIKKLAKMFGTTPEAYAKMLKEDNVDYV